MYVFCVFCVCGAVLNRRAWLTPMHVRQWMEWLRLVWLPCRPVTAGSHFSTDRQHSRTWWWWRWNPMPRPIENSKFLRSQALETRQPSMRRTSTYTYTSHNPINQSINHHFFVHIKVDQRAGQLSLLHVGITKTERNRTKTKNQGANISRKQSRATRSVRQAERD